jgi:hypothetical protein
MKLSFSFYLFFYLFCLFVHPFFSEHIIFFHAPSHTYNMYSRNVIDVDWGLVVKLALPGKVTRRACKDDRFLTNVQFHK